MFAAVLALAVAAPGDNHTIEWKLKEGDTFFNKTTVDMTQEIEFLGQKVEQQMTMKTVLRFKVKSVKDGATVVEMTYLDNKIDAPGLPGFNVGDKLKNVTFTATLDKDRKVTKFEGYDKFLDALTDGDEDQKKLMKAMMPESAVRQMPAQMFAVGPGKPVAVGDTWKRDEKLALGAIGNIETKQDFKLTEVKDDVATITEKADLTFKAGDGDAGLPFQIKKADLKVDKYTGTHKFDIKAGRAAESKVDMNMGGTMTIAAAGQEIDAKLAIKMTTVSVISDKNPIVD
jgi:hypothetical protein